MKLPDAGLPSASGCQKPGKQMFCFLFAGPVRTQRLWEGVSKPKERSASIRLGPGHCLGRGWAQPAPMLALADAGAWRGTGLLFSNLRRSITRRWTREGFSYWQWVKSSVGQERVLQDAFGLMPCFYVDLWGWQKALLPSGGREEGAVIFPTPLLNGCLVGHLLYQTFMPFQKWGFSCVGLVVVVSFSVVCKISFEYICPYLSKSTPEGECLSIRGTSFFGSPCLDGQKGCFLQPS